MMTSIKGQAEKVVHFFSSPLLNPIKWYYVNLVWSTCETELLPFACDLSASENVSIKAKMYKQMKKMTI